MAKSKTRKKRKPARGGPMQMTASSGYAIHGLAYLSFRGEDRIIYLSEISDYFKIPSSYLAKVFQTLARGGLVVSYRGAKGGYALSRPGNEISLREVIELFEGPVRSECPLMGARCNLKPRCTVYARFEEAQTAFLDTLDTHSIGVIGDELKRLEESGKGLDKLVREAE